MLAVLAVLVGVVGIGEEDVLRALGESSAPTPGTSETSPEPAATSQSFATRGGAVVATCERITAMSPAQAFKSTSGAPEKANSAASGTTTTASRSC